MELIRRNHFMVSTPAILKLVETVLLVTGMVLFLISNKCQSFSTYVALHVLPIVVCVLFTLVSYTTAIMVLAGGRNPFATRTWIKGEVWLNLCAGLLMVLGSTFTLTRTVCSNTSLTVLAIGLGYIAAVLFACSGVITYLTYMRYKEEVKVPLQVQHGYQQDGHRATLAAIT